MGAAEEDRLRRIISHCYLLILFLTFAISAMGLLFASSILKGLGAAPEVLPLATEYAEIWFFGFPAMGLAMVSNGIIRAYGDATYPGYIMTVAPVIQVTLGPLLIFGVGPIPAMALEGAAWSFVIGAMTQLALAAYWYFIKARLIPTSEAPFKQCSPNPSRWSPCRCNQFTATHHTRDKHVLGRRLRNRSSRRIWCRRTHRIGSRHGGHRHFDDVVPVVGQNWGPRSMIEPCWPSRPATGPACLGSNRSRIDVVWRALFVALITNDELAATVAVEYLSIVPLSIGFMGMLTVANHGFNAIRRPGPALALSVARLVLIYLPLALIASYYFAYLGIFAAIALANVIAGLAAATWFRKQPTHWRNTDIYRLNTIRART